jgi:methanogen homoisocitrate dehydrogenase
MYNLTVIPGDGIGIEVMGATLDILEVLNVEFNYKLAYAGNDCFIEKGSTIPDETILAAKEADAILFGAVTTVPGQKSAIITLRQELDLFVNLRPVKSFVGCKCLFGGLDFVIVRENTEGLYKGVEEFTDEGATALRVVTWRASERICRFAFDYAVRTGRGKVTAVHKANVLKKTDGVFRDSFYKVAVDYPGVVAEDRYVDATAMFFITKPYEFDVVVTTNLFGDILSDEGAGLVGGLGLIPSANIGDDHGLFEPVHGSAPRLAGRGIANPSAMILSACMMLDYLDEQDEAQRLENALMEVLKEGETVTPDLGGTSTTTKMALAIKQKLEK